MKSDSALLPGEIIIIGVVLLACIAALIFIYSYRIKQIVPI